MVNFATILYFVAATSGDFHINLQHVFALTSILGGFTSHMTKTITSILAIIALLLVPALPAEAGDASKPAFGGDFTFKKIKPPSNSTKKRINIQIEPAPPASKAPATKDTSDDTPHSDTTHGWFWNKISPDINATETGRFLDAVSALENAPKGEGIAAPSLDMLQSIASEHGAHILLETVNSKLSPAFILAVIAVESGGKIQAESSKGAKGLMQLIPDTATRFGVEDITDPAQNIRGGVAYLEWLMRKFNGDPILALAGYNAGENAVMSHRGVPPYSETRSYIPKVLAAWKAARGVCQTPPKFFSDGCVFRLKDAG